MAVSSTTGSQCAQTFTIFPLLPLELRRKIWANTFQPRILEYDHQITHVAGIEGHKGTTTYDRFSCTKTPPTLPIALQVCHEARAVVREHYTLSVGGSETPVGSQSQSSPEPRPIYFNPHLDIVVLVDSRMCIHRSRRWHSTKYAPRNLYRASPDFADVKTLVLKIDDWEEMDQPQVETLHVVFPALQKILLAQCSHEPGRDTRSTLSLIHTQEVRLSDRDMGAKSYRLE